jgi:fused signal recognition particle receptor
MIIMFGFLKKRLSESVEKLSDKIRKKEEVEVKRPAERPKLKKEPRKPEKPKPPKAKKGVKKPPKEEPKIAEEKVEVRSEVIKEGVKEEPKEEKGFLARLRRRPEEKKPTLRERVVGRVLERKISGKDIDSLFEEIELGLMEANVAVETIDFLKDRMKEYLADRQLKRGEIEKEVRNTLEKILVEIFDQGEINLERLAKKKKPVSIVFLGFNGSGKTTSIAKLGKYLTNKKFKVVLAAGDTFRAASIEQLEVHGGKLGLKVIKHKYGSDSAAVVYDAIEHAKSKGIDFVLADTAGRSHANRDLVDELKKVVRVNKPDLKILVMDSLTGNDLVEQSKKFDEAVGIDAMIFTKVDVNEKGGGMLSACHAVKKPILYIGLGQDYGDIEIFDAKKFVKDLMGG